jgi:hypothetical protein
MINKEKVLAEINDVARKFCELYFDPGGSMG